MRYALFVSTMALAMLVGGCSLFDKEQPLKIVAEQASLPPVPDRYRLCFAGTTVLPPGAWSAAVTADVAAALRGSELTKTTCGRDFLQWYEDVKAGRKPKD
jgi:hypothetical protein